MPLLPPRLTLSAAICAAAFTATAAAQPLRVRLENGTTGGPGQAELLTLYRLGEGMEPVASVESPGSETMIERPPGAGRPFLLQAAYRGVNYNQPVPPNTGPEVTLTVYETFSAWAEPDIGLSTWRILYRRLPPAEAESGLRVDQIFIVENRSVPPRTFLEDEETLRFRLPPDTIRLDLPRISATGATGMPVPQSSFPVGDEGDYAIRTAFKPGETEVVLSYRVRYDEERYQAELIAPRASPEVLLLASPPDIRMELPEGAPAGWDILGPDEAAGLTAARKFGIEAGEPVRMVFRGGSAPPATAAGGGPGRPLPPLSEAAGEGDPGGARIGLLPDPTLGSKWTLALLMAAALAFGLLHRAFGGSRPD